MAERKIYQVSGYPEEVIAVAFARTSRVAGTIQDSLNVLTEKKAGEFHEKWVVGYGHASVAEHAVVHLALEGVSRLATESIESSRLASYTEKSTRFQKITPDQTLTPKSVINSPWRNDWDQAHSQLFAAYDLALDKVGAEVKKAFPARDGETSEKHDVRVRTKYTDICRFGLPLSVLANLGLTANARVLEAVCSQLLSSPLKEVREIGEEMKREAMKVAPTLIKYAAENLYLRDTPPAMRAIVGQILAQGEIVLPEGTHPEVELVDYDPQAEQNFIAGWLYRFGNGAGFTDCLRIAGEMSLDQKRELIKQALSRMGRYDKVGREAELLRLTYDVNIDNGGFGDFKRNRMMTQIHQEFTGVCGLAIPRIIDNVGAGEQMRAAIRFAADLAQVLKGDLSENEYKYLFTNATMRRMLLAMNMRELFDFWRTRSAPNTNPSYRYAALVMGDLAKRAYPLIWEYTNMIEKESPVSSQDVLDAFYLEGKLI
ncbi:MAG: FAD-dependent thymidylate synthase [bacterium]|nr:FAD-dependent thymidylate synthase [bacterium]